MRIALVSPYSWTYPGGVTRHIQALAEEFLAAGHDVRVLAPSDPDDRLAAHLHRGARPQSRPRPDYLIDLGRTVGFSANGAVSNLALTPFTVATLRHELAHGGYDVAHIHEPIAPIVSWDAVAAARLPLVATYHAYSTNRLTNGIGNLLGARRIMNHVHVRIAVSEAAAWTARRFFGGRYRVIPNGVHVPGAPPAPRPPADRLRIVFVGQAVERKGLPVLARAFEALREHVPAELVVVGAGEEEVFPLMLDPAGVTALGKVSDEEKRARLEAADVLCAPSLGGESFGMVLTEAFAAGTPVVASDIAGYRDVLRHGQDGLLVPRGDPVELAEALRELWLDPARRAEMSTSAFERAQRFAWPRVAAEVIESYEDAIAMPVPERRLHRAAVRVGVMPADGQPREPARRLPSLEPAPVGRTRSPAARVARRAGVVAAAVAVVALAAYAVRRIGLDSIGQALISSSPAWVLLGLGLMCAAMAMRAVSWHAILRAALPGVRVRLSDALQGTFIGVLMSATLPARLGEPSRAMVVARRVGRPRVHLPVVLGTLVSQTLLNILALAILGTIMFTTVDVFHGHQGALLAFAITPVALLASVLLAPIVLRHSGHSRFARLHAVLDAVRGAVTRVRSGLRVFRNPRLGAVATLSQLSAWALQAMSCYVLLIAFGLDHRAGVTAAAAVLFAVNVTAVLPATPSNLGVFQAACVAVLSGGYHLSPADALGYGIILQAVEVATAIIMGMPALVKEGVSWKDIRLRALHTAPVTLPALPRSRRRTAGAFEHGN